jgi:CheY-like chemotaxis protein
VDRGTRDPKPLELALLVEDEPDMHELFRIFLGRVGYQVLSAYDGEEALRRLEEEVPSLILTDLMLPRMDGWELLRRVKANPSWKDIPVVVMSAGHRLESFDSSFFDVFLAKPFTKSQLVAALEAARKK